MNVPVTTSEVHIFEDAANRILEWFHLAEEDLIGRIVALFNGEAGMITDLKLDEHHGLCLTFDERPNHIFRDGLPPVRWYPVSTIREI